jgi:ElaB/YqjD/DUF883 family membrane-anchored ribosome-binding protein
MPGQQQEHSMNRTTDMNETLERRAGNLKSAAQGASDAGKDALDSAGRKASNFAAKAGESVSELAAEGRDMAADMASRGADYAQSYVTRLEDASRRNPLGAIATALFAGVVIGYLTRGRR